MTSYKTYASGKVQGVFFRNTAKEQADSLGITGYARNLPDGRVELCMAGERNAIELCLEKIQANPGLGRVDAFSPLEECSEGPFSNFRTLG